MMSEIPDLENQLKVAKNRLETVATALKAKFQGDGLEEWHVSHQEVLRAERRLAAAKGEEYAEQCDFPLKWDAGAPMPHLMVNDHNALLAFLLSEPNPAWDGTYLTLKSPKNIAPEPLALVEFERCLIAKLGGPNDEVFEGHPLFGRGGDAYAAQRVVNSRWIQQLQAINSVHSQYDPKYWVGLNHYVFWFHDSTFECIAKKYTVTTYRITFREMLDIMVERLIA